jgi:hypothetical protein
LRHVARKGEKQIQTLFWWADLTGRVLLKDLGVDCVMLKWISKKED